jgi:hypothetical protein
VIDAVDEVIQDRIRGRVRDLSQDVLATHQSHDACLPRGPEVLPPSSQRVLAARDHSVKVLDELGIPTKGVANHHVMVVGHHAHDHDVDLKP